MPNAANSGTMVAVAPWLLADMSSEPERSAVSIAASSPSWADGATLTSILPPLFCFTALAKATAASCRGFPGAAPCPSVSFVWANVGPTASVSAAAASREGSFIASLLWEVSFSGDCASRRCRLSKFSSASP